ncbi:hypothetical protein PsorP6_000962 [Peronosclerospora sorghi]|uniref:Uncharacterized protein n=1 Tax=Peronosclerospora sorghi TaxID=230839 RepID=A0ACC0WPV2_9STRA|nr:hypothetical protein PsorP6_000962 [Peronosclerospora sorghi]
MDTEDNGIKPSQIHEHVFLGSRTHARDKELLQRLRITHILNVTPSKKMDPLTGVPNFFEKDKLFIYRRCQIFDNKAEDILGVLEGCIAFIDQAKYYGRILVHCNKGVSRSSSIVVAYLMKLRSMSLEQALAFVVDRHSSANPNVSFRAQLKEYERRLLRCAPIEKSTRTATRVGPQLRPSPAENRENVATIGPNLPPHRMRTQGDNRADPYTKKNDSKKVAIGPSLPANLKRHRVEVNKLDEDVGNRSPFIKKRTIDRSN